MAAELKHRAIQLWHTGVLMVGFWFVTPCLVPAYAATTADLFQAANQAYEAGDFGRALVYYDSAAMFVRNANLYYNRGNAHFKLGAIGRAIADYNRAYILAPTDVDIRQNLEFGRAYRPDKTLVIPNPVLRFLTALLRLVDLATVKLANGVLFFLTLLCLGLVFFGGPVQRRPLVVIAAVLAAFWLYTGASWLSWAAEVSPAKAVVVVPELTLRSGPGEEYKEMVIVHDGLEVLVRSRRGKYVLVQAPGGEGGWAESSAFEQIFPAR
ncbi:MAG: tetratricopeptide repeat protein [candidate division WOR-3 bacterium]